MSLTLTSRSERGDKERREGDGLCAEGEWHWGSAAHDVQVLRGAVAVSLDGTMGRGRGVVDEGSWTRGRGRGVVGEG